MQKSEKKALVEESDKMKALEVELQNDEK
jgi:hypothetical protein